MKSLKKILINNKQKLNNYFQNTAKKTKLIKE